MRFGSLHGGERGQHNGIGYMLMTKIFLMQDSAFIGTMSFESLLAHHTFYLHRTSYDTVERNLVVKLGQDFFQILINSHDDLVKSGC